MSTKAIEQFLRRPDEGGAYTDEKLAALLAHAKSGKLAFLSCCCIAGIPTADHEPRGANLRESNAHWAARFPSGGWAASEEFNSLSRKLDETEADTERRAKLIPLIKAEMQRRESLATHNVPARETETVTVG